LNALEREIGTTTNEEQYEDKWADLYEDDAEGGEAPATEPTAGTEGESSDSSGSDGGASGAD
jgi:hypothetical protein